MQSTPFRLGTAAVATLLLALLAYVIIFALQNPPPVAPALPTDQTEAKLTSTPVPAAKIEATPTATLPPTTRAGKNEETAAADPSAITAGGFVYMPPTDFAVTETENAATLTLRTPGSTLDTIFLLSGGPPEQFIDQPAAGLEERFQQFVNFFAEQDDFDLGKIVSTHIDSAPALTVDLSSREQEDRFRGRIVMAQPAIDRLFVMTGIAPEEAWNGEGADAYRQILGSVLLFDPATANANGFPAVAVGADPTTIAAALQPTATTTRRPSPTVPPTATPIPDSEPLPRPAAAISQPAGWQLYANANIIHDAAMVGDVLWLATGGGIVARNAKTDSFVKFTPLEGPARNGATSVTHCPLPGLGIVFGGEGGLLLFDPRIGTWNSLDSNNSGMSFDDVTTVDCVVESNLLIIGYRRHGLDLYDVSNAIWTHIDRNDGLANDFVEEVAADAGASTLWVSSGFGITILRRIGNTVTRENFLSAENSPLTDNRVHSIIHDQSGAVWIGLPEAIFQIADERWTRFAANATADIVLPPTPFAGLAAAPDNSIWVASAGGAVCKLDLAEQGCDTLLTLPAELADVDVTRLLVGTDDTIYITTAGSGVTAWKGEETRRLLVPGELLAANEISDLGLDTDGFVWVAAGDVVQQISPSEPAISRSYTHTEGTLPIDEVRVLARAPIRGIWMGGLGAAHFDGEEWRSFTTEDGLAGNVVQAIATDDVLRTWIGTKSGLSIWNGETFFNLDRSTGLPSENVTALAGDGSGMWIGSSGGGLYRFDQNQLRLFNSENAQLPSNTITALARLTDGTLLVGTDRGLATFNNGTATLITDIPAAYIDALTATEEGIIRVAVHDNGVYSFSDGVWQADSALDPLPAKNITSILVDPYGSIWFGGASGGIAREFGASE